MVVLRSLIKQRTSPIDTMMKSINQAINLSIQLASTIVSLTVFVVADDELVCILGPILLLPNTSSMAPAIRTIIPAIVRMMPTITPLNQIKLTLLFALIDGRLPADTSTLTLLFPKL
jgi:hypothetical protein